MKLPTYICIETFVILRTKSKNHSHPMHAHMAGTMFPFVIMMGEVVSDKENKFRQALSAMGLHDLSYW